MLDVLFLTCQGGDSPGSDVVNDVVVVFWVTGKRVGIKHLRC